MIYGNSVHISTLKNPMCDIWKAKMFSVIFCQLQTTVSIVECHIFQVCTFYLFPQNYIRNPHWNSCQQSDVLHANLMQTSRKTHANFTQTSRKLSFFLAHASASASRNCAGISLYISSSTAVMSSGSSAKMISFQSLSSAFFCLE